MHFRKILTLSTNLDIDVDRSVTSFSLNGLIAVLLLGSAFKYITDTVYVYVLTEYFIMDNYRLHGNIIGIMHIKFYFYCVPNAFFDGHNTFGSVVDL